MTTFAEQGSSVTQVIQGLFAPSARRVAVDQGAHRVYFPLENSRGHRVLRIYEPVTGSASHSARFSAMIVRKGVAS